MSAKKPSKDLPPPPPPSQQIPNAYDVNPMMMEALQQITPANLPMFLMSNP
jgi:hypothetical protein